MPCPITHGSRNEGKATRGRRRMDLLSDLMKGKYMALENRRSGRN